MKETDKIAILLASYNGEKYIAEQIESLLAQTPRPGSHGKRGYLDNSWWLSGEPNGDNGWENDNTPEDKISLFDHWTEGWGLNDIQNDVWKYYPGMTGFIIEWED